MCSVEARYSGLKPLIHDCASAGSLGKIVVSETIFSIGSAPKTEGDHTDAGLTPIFGEQYDRLLENVFALQDEITMCVVGAIERLGKPNSIASSGNGPTPLVPTISYLVPTISYCDHNSSFSPGCRRKWRKRSRCLKTP